jgi:hypothetical protein
MVAFSPLAVLLIALGGTSNDLVALIEAPAYFESRGVEINLDKMLELAQKTGDGKGQIMQLLAIRQLGVGFPQEKAKIIQALNPIAQGKAAQDPTGFAREYAVRTLRQLGADVPLTTPKSEGHRAKDLLSWFPGDVKVVGAAVVASVADPDSKTEERLRQLIKKLIPAQEFNHIYDVVDNIGNLQVNGFSFALFDDGMGRQDKSRIYVHVKGKADAKRFAAYLASTLPNGQLERVDDGKGGTVTIVTAPNMPPAFAFIGNTDLLLAGYGSNQADHLEVLKQMLKVRTEGKGGVLEGPLATDLKKVAPNAIAFVVGELSKSASAEFQRGLGVPLPSPTRIRLELVRTDLEVDMSLTGDYESEQQAKDFAAGLLKVNKQAIEALDKIPNNKLPAEINKLLKTALGNFRVESTGKTVALRSQAPTALIQALPELLASWLTVEEMSRTPAVKVKKD